MLLLVMRGWFFSVLLYLWISRGLVVWWTDSTFLDLRFRVRLVAMPFLDSIMDGKRAFGFGLVLTLLEFTMCMAIYHTYNRDDLPTSVRLTLTVLAIGCMLGKMCLAWVAIFPLKEGGKEDGSAVVRDETGGDVVAGTTSVAELDVTGVEDGTAKGGVEAAACSELASSDGTHLPPASHALSG
ncbi:unnamed protein product [Laminaria digitata]